MDSFDIDDTDIDFDLDDHDFDGQDDSLHSTVIADTNVASNEVPTPDPLDGHDTNTGLQDKNVTFPDGTHVKNPHQDSLGYVYPDYDSYVHKLNQHTLAPNGIAQAGT